MPISFRLASSQYDPAALVTALRDLNKGIERSTKTTEEDTRSRRETRDRGAASERSAIRAGVSAAALLAREAGPAGGLVSSAVAGLALGGPAGAAAGAVAGAFSLGVDLQRAGQQGALRAPLFATPGRVAIEGEFGRESFKNTVLQGLDALAGVVDPFDLLGPQPDLGTRRQRALEQKRASRFAALNAAVEEAGGFFGDIAAAGGRIDDRTIRQVGAVLISQNEDRFRTQKRVLRILEELEGVNIPQSARDGNQ